MAGGDGSLGAVASVAVDHDLPFACIPFGTRNHFARDLGLDGDDPIGALAVFSGRERRVDVGSVGEIVFVNNVSLGLYASLVHDSAGATKNRLRAGMRMFPAAFGRSRQPLDLTLDDGGRAARLPAFIVLVANNDYALDAISDLGGRSRLDEGRLHAYVVEAVGRFRLAVLLGRALAGRVGEVRGYSDHSAETLQVDARRPRVHVAVDGEPAVLPAPLDFRIRPRALRVLVTS